MKWNSFSAAAGYSDYILSGTGLATDGLSNEQQYSNKQNENTIKTNKSHHSFDKKSSIDSLSIQEYVKQRLSSEFSIQGTAFV